MASEECIICYNKNKPLLDINERCNNCVKNNNFVHNNCLNIWLEKKNKCPLCYSNININNTINNNRLLKYIKYILILFTYLIICGYISKIYMLLFYSESNFEYKFWTNKHIRYIIFGIFPITIILFWTYRFIKIFCIQ